MTSEEAFLHLKETFRLACNAHPEIMEPYMIGAVDIGDDGSELVAFMRTALRETFAKRYPPRFKSVEALQ